MKRSMLAFCITLLLASACASPQPTASSGGAATELPTVSPATSSAATQPENAPTPRAVASGWEKIEPGGDTICAHGTPYAYWVRRGISGRLMIFFRGGGGCWDAETCRDNGKEVNTYYDSRITENDHPRHEDGILDLSNPDNPFKDDTIVYIPVCTGDVHWGNNVHTFEDPAGDVTIQFKGYVNADAALDWAYQNEPKPESVFVTGCSAGSPGSLAHAADIIEHYPGIRVTQAGDSLAFLFEDPTDLKTDWGIDETFPDWLDVDASQFTMADAIIGVANHYPDHVFANYNSNADDVQVFFTYLDHNRASDWTALLDAHLAKIHAAAPNYRSFTAGGNEHCVFSTENFYFYAQDSHRLRDWVADLASGKDVPDLHCTDCSAPERKR